MKEKNIISVYSLVIEIGRLCTRKCKHCLRGCMEDVTIDFKYIEEVLSQINGTVNCITFTGGEPLLYADVIIQTLDYIMSKGIEVLNFYIASNGEIYNEQVIKKLLEFYYYAEEMGGSDISAYDISNDQFHEPNYDVIDMLYDLPFYTERKPIPTQGIIQEGLAEENGIGRRMLEYKESFSCTYWKTDKTFIEVEMLYLNAFGNLYAECDFSYDTQRDLRTINCMERKLLDIFTDKRWCEVTMD